MSPEEGPSLHAPRRGKRVDPGIVRGERRRPGVAVPYVNTIDIVPGFDVKTVVDPLDGLDEWPLMNPICQLYSVPPTDPATWKVIELAPEPAVPQWNTPPNDSPHTVPLGSPVSVNVTVYVTGVNTISTEIDDEEIVNGELGLDDDTW